MMPKWHILYGAIFAAILYFITDYSLIAVSVVFLASVFIDLDKAILFTLKEKSINPVRFWEHGKNGHKRWKSVKNKREYKHNIRFFHGLEVFLVLILLSFVHTVFLWIFLGFFLHVLLDLIHYIENGEDVFLKLSIIYTFITNKNKKLLY